MGWMGCVWAGASFHLHIRIVHFMGLCIMFCVVHDGVLAQSCGIGFITTKEQIIMVAQQQCGKKRNGSPFLPSFLLCPALRTLLCPPFRLPYLFFLRIYLSALFLYTHPPTLPTLRFDSFCVCLASKTIEWDEKLCPPLSGRSLFFFCWLCLPSMCFSSQVWFAGKGTATSPRMEKK